MRRSKVPYTANIRRENSPDVQPDPEHAMSSLPAHCYARHDDVVTREILGETLLVPISARIADMSNIFALNETGAFIWEHLDGATSLEGIRDALAADFEVSPESAWSDLETLVADLEQAGLIRRVTTPDAETAS